MKSPNTIVARALWASRRFGCHFKKTRKWTWNQKKKTKNSQGWKWFVLGRKARAIAKSRKWSRLLGLWYRRWVIGSKVKEAVWEKVGQGFEKGDQMSGLILWAAGSCSVFWAFKRSDQKKLWCRKHVAKMKLKDERLEVINQIRGYFCVGFFFGFCLFVCFWQ